MTKGTCFSVWKDGLKDGQVRALCQAPAPAPEPSRQGPHATRTPTAGHVDTEVPEGCGQEEALCSPQVLALKQPWEAEGASQPHIHLQS